MFAIIKTGGKQYRVAKDSVLKIEKIDGELGSTVEFNEILMVGEAAKPSVIGMPLVNGVTVRAEIIDQMRDAKIIVFKKKRRQNYRRKKGHRQELTQIKIVDITKQ